MGWEDPWAPPREPGDEARPPASIPPMAPVPPPPAKPHRVLGLGLMAWALIGGAVLLAAIAVVQVRGGLFGAPDGEGKKSQHLAIEASKTRGLRAGETVTITSRAFRPNRVVGVAVCLAEAETAKRGVGACDTTTGARFATDAEGRLRATFPVPQAITVAGGAYDCGATADPCLLVAADAGDFDESGGLPITFRSPLGTPPTPAADRAQTDRLPIAATSPGPYPAARPVSLRATGFQPGEPILLAWCSSVFESVGPIEGCQAQDVGAAAQVLATHDLTTVAVRADDRGVVTATLPAQAAIRTLVGGTGSNGNRFDCAAKPGTCSFVIAAAADTKRSAVLPYALAN